MVDRRVQVVAGDVGTDGLGLDDDGRAALASLRHRHPLGRHRVASTRPLDGAVEVNLLGPDPHRPDAAATSASRPTSSPCRPATSPATAGARRPRSSVAREPVLRRRRLARPRSTPPAAPAPTPRPRAARPRRWPGSASEAAPRARRRRRPRCWPRRPSSAASAWVTDRMVEAGRARAASLGWPDAYAYTKALGERALLREPGRRPGVDRAAVDHRVGAAPSPGPGWIRGFRMAEPVIICYARGLLKEFPGVPEGIVDVIPVDLVVAAIIAVAGRGRRPTSGPTSPRSRRARSTRCATGSSSTSCAAGSPSTRSTTARASPSSCPSGRSRAGAGCRASSSGPRRRIERAETVLQSLPLRGKQAELGGPLEEKRERGRARPRLRRALRRLRRVRGGLRRRPPARAVRARSTTPTRPTFGFDPRVIDWDHYVHEIHLPSVVEHARVRTTPGGRTGENRERPAAPPGARPRPPPRRLRPREHAHRLERRRVVRVAGHPAPAARRPRCASSPRRWREAPGAAGARPHGPRRLPPPLLPALRGRAGRPARRGRRRDVQRPAS